MDKELSYSINDLVASLLEKGFAPSAIAASFAAAALSIEFAIFFILIIHI
jgi:hypothetical protein